MPKNWNRRFKHNRDKMKTGDILELAEVVRNLALRDHEKGLSTGEKQMFVKAKKILASELMYAKGLDEEEAGVWLDEVLVGRPVERRREEEVDDESRRNRVGDDLPSLSVWAIVAAAGSGERLGADRPKAFVRLGELPLLAESLERLDGSDWIDGVVVAAPAGLGGAVDPARGGARGREGEQRRHRRRDAAPSPCGSRSPRCRRSAPSCSSTTRRGRSCRRT